MAAPSLRTEVSWDNYLAADEAYEGKLELLHGELYAMAGGTAAHARIILNIGARALQALRGSPCTPTSSEQRIKTPLGDGTYPDLSIWCGKAQFADGTRTLLNPTVVVEVLSPTTELWDRSGKLALYMSIPSLRHVLLVAHDTWTLTLYSRRDDGTWTFATAHAGESLQLEAVGLTLAVDDVYEGMDAVDGPARDALPRRPLTPR